MKKKVLLSKISWLQTPQNGHFENKPIKTERLVISNMSRLARTKKIYFQIRYTCFYGIFQNSACFNQDNPYIFCLCAQETQSK